MIYLLLIWRFYRLLYKNKRQQKILHAEYFIVCKIKQCVSVFFREIFLNSMIILVGMLIVFFLPFIIINTKTVRNTVVNECAFLYIFVVLLQFYFIYNVKTIHLQFFLARNILFNNPFCQQLCNESEYLQLTKTVSILNLYKWICFIHDTLTLFIHISPSSEKN